MPCDGMQERHRACRLCGAWGSVAARPGESARAAPAIATATETADRVSSASSAMGNATFLAAAAPVSAAGITVWGALQVAQLLCRTWGGVVARPAASAHAATATATATATAARVSRATSATGMPTFLAATALVSGTMIIVRAKRACRLVLDW